MPTEKEKMLCGALYDALDPELISERKTARLLVKRLNDTNDDEPELRKKILSELIPKQGESLWIEPPFYCDYGKNIVVGNKVFFNFNCVVLDVMKVTIGNNVMFGPGVQILTPLHPINHLERASGLEYAKAITIGSEVQCC